MLSIYIVLGVIGGGLILLSALGAIGHDDAGFDAHHGVDLHHDAHGLRDSGDVWLPFLSLRFWIYAFACFGLIGILATVLSSAKEPTIGFVATGTGLVMGFVAAWAYRAISKSEVHGGVGADDLIGAMGKVMVPVASDKTGRVRVLVKGDTIDMLALSEGSRIEAGEEIVVTGVENDRALVARKAEWLGE